LEQSVERSLEYAGVRVLARLGKSDQAGGLRSALRVYVKAGASCRRRIACARRRWTALRVRE